MDDERLLSEALRAHAAGGVSTPSGIPGGDRHPDDDASRTDPQADDRGRGRGRFRPLARARRGGAGSPPAPPGMAPPPLAYPGAMASTAGGAGRPAPGAPGPGPIGPPTGRGGALPPASPYPALGGGPSAPLAPGPLGPPSPAGPAASDADGWPATRVAWWSLVAVFGGGVLGGVIAVISLAMPG